MLHRLLLRLRPLDRLPTAARYALATLPVAAVVVARVFVPALDGYLFFLLLDAVIIDALLLGRGAGVYAALLAAACAALLIERAGDVVVLAARDGVSTALFAVMALAVAVLIAALRRAVGRLADEAAEKGREAEARELLVLEISHRVKNNLQGVVGLLQLHGLRDPALRRALDDVAARVAVMARVHDRLTVRGDGDAVARVDAGAFVRDLADDLRASLLDGGPVGMRVEAEALELPLERAVPVGLIVNELLTNALKHAFPAGRAGTVTVRLRREGSNAVLEVADDGVGSPAAGPDGGGTTEGGEAGGRGGLGTTLVGLLARQLGGAAETVGGDAAGTTARVRFPCPAAGEGVEHVGHHPVNDDAPRTARPATARPA